MELLSSGVFVLSDVYPCAAVGSDYPGPAFLHDLTSKPLVDTPFSSVGERIALMYPSPRPSGFPPSLKETLV